MAVMSFLWCETHQRNVQDCRRDGTWDCEADSGPILTASTVTRWHHSLAVGVNHDGTLYVYCEGCSYNEAIGISEVSIHELENRQSNHRDAVS